MWGFQRMFRSAVESALQKSLEVLGVAVEPTVFLAEVLPRDMVPISRSDLGKLL